MLANLPVRSSSIISSTVLRIGFDREGARVAAQRAVALAAALVVVERNGGDTFALDIFPDIQLGPIQQGVDAQVGSGGEIGFVLVPEFGRLLADIPLALLVAGREVALL